MFRNDLIKLSFTGNLNNCRYVCFGHVKLTMAIIRYHELQVREHVFCYKSGSMNCCLQAACCTLQSDCNPLCCQGAGLFYSVAFSFQTWGNFAGPHKGKPC